MPSAFAQSIVPAPDTLVGCDMVMGLSTNTFPFLPEPGTAFQCIPVYIGYLIKVVILFAAGAFLIGIMLAGYKYAIGSVTSEGKEQGKKQLIGSITGFAVVVLSYLLVDTILEALS